MATILTFPKSGTPAPAKLADIEPQEDLEGRKLYERMWSQVREDHLLAFDTPTAMLPSDFHSPIMYWTFARP